MNNEYYEDKSANADDLNSETDKIKNGLRFARYLILLIMVVATLLLIFVYKDRINIDNFKRLAAKIDMGISNSGGADNTVIDFDYDTNSFVKIYKDGIVRITSNNLVIWDNAGTQFQNVLTGFSNPALVTSKKYVLAYDRGGTRLIITDSFSVLFDKVFDDNIISVSINDDGYFVVITESEAYKNKLIVYNSSFKEIYKINSLNRYIISADLTEDNKAVAVSSLYIKNSNVIPQINYYKLTDTESVWSKDFDENIAVFVKTKSDGSICALFEWGICILDSNGKEKYNYKFENKILQKYHIDNDKYNIAVVSESISGNSEISVFSNSGHKVCNLETDFEVISVDVCNDKIALLSRENLYVYSMSGKLIEQRKNTNDAVDVLFSDENSLMIVSTSCAVYNVFK